MENSMSHEQAKEKHSTRIQKKINYMLRQLKIRSFFGFEGCSSKKDMHRFHKTSGLTCGNSNCFMCGNPRKFNKERTLQEKKFMQTKNWTD